MAVLYVSNAQTVGVYGSVYASHVFEMCRTEGTPYQPESNFGFMAVLVGGYPHFAIVFSDYNSIKSEYWDT